METKSNWECVKLLLKNQKPIRLDSQRFCINPQKMIGLLSYYKFAARMIGKEKRVLDIGCNEGLGTYLLAKECGFAKGIDENKKAIQFTTDNFQGSNIEFETCKDLLHSQPELSRWNAVVCLDPENKIIRTKFGQFLKIFSKSITADGVFIVCIPGQYFKMKSTDIPREIKNEMGRFFTHVFLFSANNEAIHAGYLPCADRWLALACKKK